MDHQTSENFGRDLMGQRACVAHACVRVCEIGEKTINPCLYVTCTDFDRYFLIYFIVSLYDGC